MPGLTGKLGVDASQATAGVRQFNRELERPIGIIEQIKINMNDLRIAIENATDPTQLKSLTAEYQNNEKALQKYTGRGLSGLIAGQRGVQIAFTRSTQALMGFVFLLNSFDAGIANNELSKLRQNLLLGSQTAIGFTFAIQALGGAISKFALPVGIALGLLTTLISLLKGTGDEANTASGYVKTLVEEINKATGGGMDVVRKYYESLKAKRTPLFVAPQAVILQKLGILPEQAGLSKEEEARYQELKKIFEEEEKVNAAKQEAYTLTRQIVTEYTITKERLVEVNRALDDITTNEDERRKLLNEQVLLKRKLEEFNKSDIEKAEELAKKEKERQQENARLAQEAADLRFSRHMETVEHLEDEEEKAAKEKAKRQKELAEEAEKALQREYEMSLQLNNSAMNLADTLSAAFERAGDTGAAAFMRILSLALQIARTVSMMEFGEVGKTAGTLDILSAILGVGFARGGFTGNIPRQRIAGVVHGGEIVFEKPIVDIYKNELLALRASLQGGRTVSGYAGGGFVGSAGPLFMVGRVDIDNGKIFLRRQMPGYENYRRMKVR